MGDGRLEPRLAVGAGAGAALGATVLFAPAADAATFTVTNTNGSGQGSLAQEVFEAKDAPGDDVVVFQAGLSGTITLGGPDSDIEITGDSLTIEGPGADRITVDGGGGDRIFHLYSFGPGDSVSISGLSLTGGVYGGPGGAVRMYSGGANAADLTISGVVLTGNSAVDGGAIATDGGSLTIRDSFLSGNEASGDGGAVEVVGPERGLLIERSTIVANRAGDDAGGLGFHTPALAAAGGGVMISRSTLFANQATERGGGIGAFTTPGAMVIENSTVSGNLAGTKGGGIYAYNGSDRDWSLRNSTVAENSGAAGGGIYHDSTDSPIAPGTDTLGISSTIVAGNSAARGPDLAQTEPAVPGPDFVAEFSLIESPSTAELAAGAGGGNLVGVDPQLRSLAANGGPTQTHLPGPESPALDAGTSNGFGSDQRGEARTEDLGTAATATGSDGTDIGAVELEASACRGRRVPTLIGGDGDDTIDGGERADAIFGRDGDDSLNGLGDKDCLHGDQGNDSMLGGAGKDQLKGRVGDDQLDGQGGSDILRGQGGKDRLTGGGDRDRLAGGAGKDVLRGGPGRDTLKGNSARDRIVSGGGKDRVNCGGGRDRAIVRGKDKVSANCERVIGLG